MGTKTSHTRTPWEMQDGDGNTFRIIGDRAGRVVTWIAHTQSVQPEDAANAAFIVKAVNNHDALVEAFEQALIFIQREYPASSRAAGNWPTVDPLIKQWNADCGRRPALQRTASNGDLD